MNTITFECPLCRAPNLGDESMHGRQVQCAKCQATILVPPLATQGAPQTARLIPEPADGVPPGLDRTIPETEVFSLSPVARAYPGQVLLGMTLIFVGVAVGLAIRVRDLAWPGWVALFPLVLGLFVIVLLWIRVKSCRYRLTTQRLFVSRGWVSRHLNELELYRVKDVVVSQQGLQRLLGYGTIKVLADDDSTPEVDLTGISSPMKVKEMIRTQFRAARQREGVRPTELLQSP
jgi:membrane protein YdbS with pleckstrin-like domain